MIKNILEQEDIPEEFCKLVYDKTRGNPFFAEEVVKSLKEEEVIYLEEGKWKFKEVSAIEFPKSVKDIVKARFSRLDDECQNVLTFASFVGNDFTLEAMSALTGIEENKLLETMDRLIKTGFIKHTVIRGGDICSFADIIMRDVVYEEVGPFKRKKLHGLVGQALEKVYAGKVDEHLGELALHFLESGDKEKGLGYFLKAGEKAAKVYANSEAASYLQSALKLLEEKEEQVQEKARVLEWLGDINKLVGKHDECVKYWNEALLLWTRLQEKGKAATLHRKMATLLWDIIGNKEKAREHHEAALRILEAEPESAELAHLYEDMAHMLRRMGEVPKALTWAEKALVLAEKLNALEVVAASCIELAMEFGMIGDIKKGRDYANRALKIALDRSYLETAVMAYDKAAGWLPSEEYEKRLEYLEKALALTKKIGDITNYAYFLQSLGNEYAWRGQLDKAVTLAEEGLMLATKIGNMTYIPWCMLTLGDAYRMLGEWDKSEQYYKEAMDVSRNQNEFQTVAWGHGSFGELYLAKEEYEKAKESLQEATKENEKAGAKTPQMGWSQPLIITFIELGETEKATALLEKFRTFSQETEEKWATTGEMVLRSMLLRAQKKHKESIELFEKTLGEWESTKADIWEAYVFARWVLCEYARAYIERDQPGDKEKALNLLNRALDMFQKIGAKKDIEKVEARIAFIETGKAVSKPKSIDRVSAGYADLDKLLYGGIPSNCAVVLTSPSCDERDLLVKSFLEAGAKKGEVTFFVTIDPGVAKPFAEEFPSDFHLLVCNPEADAILKSSPNVFTLKGVENLTDISIALASAIRKLDPSLKKPRRICIGLISDVLLQHHAVETRRWLTALMTKLKSEDFTTLAVMDPEMHPPQEVRAVLDLFDGEINIFKKETEKGSEKFLKIQKMSGHKYLEEELPLKKEQL
jgi:tetratricopeptide (TPR) repeat protein